ncbi:hypothetical protein EW146_g3750 [Bondarzewia mesenterica]|uniref:Uncharacterized protein n=1 Tax=Bondarzewia mesenterica TaxID=1095465 RepID=A0A4S4LXW8_9AGAM|nr:hypothetical protein EW146_g3750 [Bondarzewia mesenterica]
MVMCATVAEDTCKLHALVGVASSMSNVSDSGIAFSTARLKRARLKMRIFRWLEWEERNVEEFCTAQGIIRSPLARSASSRRHIRIEDRRFPRGAFDPLRFTIFKGATSPHRQSDRPNLTKSSEEVHQGRSLARPAPLQASHWARREKKKKRKHNAERFTSSIPKDWSDAKNSTEQPALPLDFGTFNALPTAHSGKDLVYRFPPAPPPLSGNKIAGIGSENRLRCPEDRPEPARRGSPASLVNRTGFDAAPSWPLAAMERQKPTSESQVWDDTYRLVSRVQRPQVFELALSKNTPKSVERTHEGEGAAAYPTYLSAVCGREASLTYEHPEHRAWGGRTLEGNLDAALKHFVPSILNGMTRYRLFHPPHTHFLMPGDTARTSDASRTFERARCKIDSDVFQVIQVTQETTDGAEHLQTFYREGNPYIPPASGCPVNELPTELLSYIFELGTTQDILRRTEGGEVSDGDDSDHESELELEDVNEEGEGEGEEEEEEEEEEGRLDLEFQLLVSHVCRRWRDVALRTPSLWTHLNFTEGPPFEKSKAWIARSKGCPLYIDIDCTMDSDDGQDDGEEVEEDEQHFRLDDEEEEEGEGETDGSTTASMDIEFAPTIKPPRVPFTPSDLDTIRSLIMPEVRRWYVFECLVEDYLIMHGILQSLATAPEASQLRQFHLYHYEDCEDYVTFKPAHLIAPVAPFGGRAPNLTHCALWGVHVDWPRCAFLSGLEEFELAYHAKDVRPAYDDFARILKSSPKLTTLTLCLSGPAGDPKDWPRETLEMPSVRNLVLSFLEPPYVSALLSRLLFPTLTALALDFDQGDFSDWIDELVRPMPGHARSVLHGLESVKISGLPCSHRAIDALYGAMPNVKTLNLNCRHLDQAFFDKLFFTPRPGPSIPSSSAAAAAATEERPMLLPNLQVISTTGISGEDMCALVESRKPRSIRRVLMEAEDDVDLTSEEWLRDHVEHFSYFEGSEDEDVDLLEIEVEDLE